MGERDPHTPSGTQADSSAPMEPLGSQIRMRDVSSFGKYELLSRLRTGGMAEVFVARESDDPDRLVALKRILPSFTDEADYVAMFIDEARLGMQLKHSSIAEAFEVGQVDDVHYIALEYVHGQDLSLLLRRAREKQEPVPIAIACQIAVDICRALSYAHALRDDRGSALGVVHRDVSPQNVLISYQGDVKLIDFGIAKSSEQLMRTQAGLLKGKHGYLSPEQAEGKQVDRRSDIFSLGICLYEMLSAQRLFEGSSDFSTLVKVRRAEVPQLTKFNSTVSRELASIVHRALGRDRMERYQTAAEMAEALTRFVERSDQRCDRKQLAQFMRERFPEGSDAEAEDDARGPGTGLLDAFGDIDPVSSVSQLTELPEATEDPAPGGDPTEVLDLTDAEPVEELDEVEEADESVSTEVAAAAQDYESLAKGRDQATRVVTYQSTLDGQLVEPRTVRGTASEGVSEIEESLSTEGAVARDGTDPGLGASSRVQPASVRAPTLPGLGMEWDEEEQSTHIYDRPEEDGELVSRSIAARLTPTPTPVSQPRASLPSRRPSTLRPDGIPHQSAPTVQGSATSRLSDRASGAPSPFVSIRPSSARAPQPSLAPAAHPSRSDQRSLGWVALCVVAILGAVVGGLWFFRAPALGTMHLSTSPSDVAVTVDGVAAVGAVSPFVLAGLSPGVLHTVEVSKEGYRSWKAQLSVRSGEVMQLPLVELMPEPTAQAPATADPIAPTPRAEVRPAKRALTPRAAEKTERAPLARPRERATPSPRAPTERPRPIASPEKATAAQSGTGSLRINSRPWSVVYVDGRMVGNTPQMNIMLSAGKHTITLANSQFDLKKTLTVQIKNGETVTKIVDLSSN